jgi:hypothetical protein
MDNQVDLSCLFSNRPYPTSLAGLWAWSTFFICLEPVKHWHTTTQSEKKNTLPEPVCRIECGSFICCSGGTTRFGLVDREHGIVAIRRGIEKGSLNLGLPGSQQFVFPSSTGKDTLVVILGLTLLHVSLSTFTSLVDVHCLSFSYHSFSSSDQ